MRILGSPDLVRSRPKKSNVAPSFHLEAMDNHQMLSVDEPVVADVRPLIQPAITAKAVQPRLVANACFLGSTTLEGISGELALKIKMVSFTAATATLYSTNWDDFSVAVTCTINSAGAMFLTGKTSACTVTSFKGTIDSASKTITGSYTIVQTGLNLCNRRIPCSSRFDDARVVSTGRV
jgi:hypothetical protein